MPYVKITLDFGAAMPAYKMVWNYPNIFSNVIIHLGDFHIMKEAFAVLGMLIEGSGFEDIAFQSGIFTTGSLNGVIAGTHCNGLFHFLSVQGDGRKIPGLVKSMNFQRSSAKSPKIPGGWQHFATKFIEIEIFTLTDFSRQSCRCKQEFQGKKGKNIFQGLDWRIVLPLNPPGTEGR